MSSMIPESDLPIIIQHVLDDGQEIISLGVSPTQAEIDHERNRLHKAILSATAVPIEILTRRLGNGDMGFIVRRFK